MNPLKQKKGTLFEGALLDHRSLGNLVMLQGDILVRVQDHAHQVREGKLNFNPTYAIVKSEKRYRALWLT